MRVRRMDVVWRHNIKGAAKIRDTSEAASDWSGVRQQLA